MCETQGENDKMVGAEKTVEISADVEVIADAIYAGLSRIAEAIEYHGRVTAGFDDVEEPPAQYIDGTPMR